jgi:hypothetical protein
MGAMGFWVGFLQSWEDFFLWQVPEPREVREGGICLGMGLAMSGWKIPQHGGFEWKTI